MNAQDLLIFGFGILLGASVGAWRVWAYARKLIHFGVSLDSWSDYSEAQRQAHGSAQRNNITPLHRDSRQ